MTEKAQPNPFGTAIAAALDAETAKARLQKTLLDTSASAILASERTAKGGGKLSRSETVTVRLDPKLRYLAELAARLHRRTLSSYVEWAIKASLDTEVVRPTNTPSNVGTDHTIGNEAEYLWDVDDADRFAKLALRYSHLLTHDEQVLWKLIRECGYLWRGSYGPPPAQEWKWRVVEDSFLFDRLRDKWELFGAVANGDKPASDLPTWVKSNRPAPKSSIGFDGLDSLDDDIKF